LFSDGELFIIGRIKDLLIVYGRNHSPDDIEATIQQITRGCCVAIAVPDEGTEQLVAIIELKKRGESDEDAMHKLDNIKGEITSTISNSHGLGVADLVLVPPGSIPITTSGKVRRAAHPGCRPKFLLQGSGGDGEGKVTPVIEASIPAWRVSVQPPLRQFQPDHVRESPRRYRKLLGLGVADFVLVPPGSIPITTSGKARRAVCVERYRQGPFARLDV
jgi:acyl-CoA synthetase (AMP-forming)/AMP-acid ligase II